jgi:hypothetical protein
MSEDSLLASALDTDEGVVRLDSDDDELVWEDLELAGFCTICGGIHSNCRVESTFHVAFSERIGIGGFAEVFKGKWLGADVAVKKLINQRQTPESLDEFRSEVAIMRFDDFSQKSSPKHNRSRHPNTDRSRRPNTDISRHPNTDISRRPNTDGSRRQTQKESSPKHNRKSSLKHRCIKVFAQQAAVELVAQT